MDILGIGIMLLVGLLAVFAIFFIGRKIGHVDLSKVDKGISTGALVFENLDKILKVIDKDPTKENKFEMYTRLGLYAVKYAEQKASEYKKDIEKTGETLDGESFNRLKKEWAVDFAELMYKQIRKKDGELTDDEKEVLDKVIELGVRVQKDVLNKLMNGSATPEEVKKTP